MLPVCSRARWSEACFAPTKRYHIDMIFTRRLVIFIVLVAPPVALGGLSSVFLWLGLISNVALLLAFVVDWVNTPPPRHVSARRSCEEKLSLGARNVVELRLRNRADVALTLEVRDEPPHQAGIVCLTQYLLFHSD